MKLLRTFRLFFSLVTFSFFGVTSLAQSVDSVEMKLEQLSTQLKWDTIGTLEEAEELYLTTQKGKCETCFYLTTDFLANVFIEKSSYANALDYLLRAENYARLKRQDETERKYQYLLGQLYERWKVYRKAIEYYQKALENPIQDRAFSFNLHRSLAFSFKQLGQERVATSHFSQAYRLLEDRKDYNEKTIILRNLVDLYKSLGEIDSAITFEQENLSLKEEMRDESAKLKSLNNIAVLYRSQSKFQQSLEYFNSALNHCRHYGTEQEVAIILSNMSLVHESLRDYDQAIDHMESALAVYERIPDSLSQARSHNYLAAIFMVSGNSSKTIDHAKKALDIRGGNDEIALSSYNILSKVHEAIGNEALSQDYQSRLNAVAQRVQQGSKTLETNEQEKIDIIASKEEEIRFLMMDREIKELKLDKLKLEGLEKAKSIELLKKQNELKQLALKQEKLERERTSQSLEITRQQLAGEIREREIAALEREQSELALAIKERELSEAKKQQEIEQLSVQNKLNELKISEKEANLSRQRLIRNVLIASVILVGFIGWLVYNRQKLRQQNRQTQLQTQKLELEQRLLRSQMNPHFIYNSMSSIQGFIMGNKIREADRYLSKFGKLMRNILEQSRQPLISLDDEINTILLYLELEQLRFDHAFDFVLDVDPEIDPDSTGIPPMILQPYLENSIKHGILPLRAPGKIMVSFELKNDTLFCTIEDNGIGRQKSMELKKDHETFHRSLGMEVTKDRLNILNKDHKERIGVNIVDLQDEVGKGIGTRIELQIPFQEFL